MSKPLDAEPCDHGAHVELVDTNDGLPPYVQCLECKEVALVRDQGNWVPLEKITSLRIAFSKLRLEPGEQTYADVAMGKGVEKWVAIR